LEFLIEMFFYKDSAPNGAAASWKNEQEAIENGLTQTF
jgi:hypothetical protein